MHLIGSRAQTALPSRGGAILLPATAPAARRGSCSALVLGALLITLASSAHAGLYKWTDERGRIHYSDKMPADAVNRASYELNRQGQTVRKTEQARPVVQRVPKD